jgi:hypothetical protein
VETLDDTISSEQVIPGEPAVMTPLWIMIVKFGSLILSWWGAIEISGDHFGSPDTVAEPGPQTDQTAGPGTGFGKIIRPNGLKFSEASSSPALVDWNVDPRTAPDGRSYDLAIDRSTQAWWAPRTENRGFSGRWGPRVTNDPNNRRCGMKCPDFLIMFLEAIAIQMVKGI